MASDGPTPSSAELHRCVAALVAEARGAFQRRAIAVCGPRAWTEAITRRIVALAGLEDVVYLSAQPPADAHRVVHPRQPRRVLGQQAQAVVVDVHDGVPPDAIGAVAGVAAGGGLFIMRRPAGALSRSVAATHKLAVVPFAPDEVTEHFLEWFARVWRASPGVARVVHGQPIVPARPVPAASPSPPSPDPDCRTADQARAVAAVERVARGRRRRPAVLIADRGRGKSTALGIAAGRLLRQSPRTIVLIAPSRAAVAPVFEHAARVAGVPNSTGGSLQVGEGTLRYVGLAELAGALPDAARGSHLTADPAIGAADLVLVDEAAAVPVPILVRILRTYARVAFSTTVHGYEGTGRGFALRFGPLLDREAPGWRTIRLHAPVRWAPGDPVEASTFSSLLLDAGLESIGEQAEARLDIARLERARLVDEPDTLRAVFGLLVAAHYRTSPGDLERLLDAPNLAVWVARRQAGELTPVVAAALVADEGGVDPALAAAIYEGRRRPHGLLLPETLAAHSGIERAPCLRSVRIVRIAVHPAARQRGVGRALLDAVIADARGRAIDYAGAAFGATADLLRFWRRCGLEPVRIGVSRGSSSGLFSAVVGCGLSPAGVDVLDEARAHFESGLPHLLGDPLRAIEPTLALSLLRRRGPVEPPALREAEWRELAAFAYGRRVPEVVIGPVWRLSCALLAEPELVDALSATERRLVVTRILQRRSWADSTADAGIAGRPAGRRALAQALRPALARWGGAIAQSVAARFARG